MVAIKPSTGEILAVANAPADGFNAAFQGSLRTWLDDEGRHLGDC